jgi:hypothetical protein
LFVGMVSSSGYGAMIGICCAALLDIDESVDMRVLRLSYLSGPRFGDSLLSFLDDVRGGKSGPLISLLPCLCILCMLALPSTLPFLSGRPILTPVLSIESCREVAPVLSTSFAALARSLACFFFRPCSKLMMMSRIRGRYLSKLACDASCDSVSSSILLSRSGTGPRSFVSTPIELKLRHAIPCQRYYTDTYIMWQHTNIKLIPKPATC